METAISYKTSAWIPLQLQEETYDIGAGSTAEPEDGLFVLGGEACQRAADGDEVHYCHAEGGREEAAEGGAD